MTSLKLLHDVKKRTACISACKYARGLIPFSFLWFRWLLNSTWLLSSYLHDRITSRNDVMTSLYMRYLSQLVEVLERWFFLVSMVFWVAEFKNIKNLVFACVVMSLSDAMTSLAWLYDVTKLTSSILACRVPRHDSLLVYTLYIVVWVA